MRAKLPLVSLFVAQLKDSGLNMYQHFNDNILGSNYGHSLGQDR